MLLHPILVNMFFHKSIQGFVNNLEQPIVLCMLLCIFSIWPIFSLPTIFNDHCLLILIFIHSIHIISKSFVNVNFILVLSTPNFVRVNKFIFKKKVKNKKLKFLVNGK